MKFFSAVWINLISAVVLLALVSFPLSEISGEFVLALAAGTSAANDPLLGSLGRAFGFFLLILLGVGAILVPGELLGFVRFYRRGIENSNHQEFIARAFLLGAVSVLSIASITSLAMIGARFAG